MILRLSQAHIEFMFRHQLQKRYGALWALSAAIKTAGIVRAFCPKSVGAAFRSPLARCMKSMGHVSCKFDMDLWLKSEIRPEDGYSFTHMYFTMWMAFFASITMQMLHFSDYINPSNLSQDLAIQTCTLVQS